MCGTSKSIELPDWGRLRAGRGRLRGLRCIHTHLRDEGLDRDDLTDLALLRLDAMVAITMDERGLPKLAHVGSLRPVSDGGDPVELLTPTPPANLDFDFPAWIRDIEDELGRLDRTRKIGSREGAILVSVSAGRAADELEAHLAELVELARSADVEVIDTVTQQRNRVDPRYVIGPGKLQDLVIHALQSGVDLVIFDQSLSPTQARNLAQRLDLRVIDRTQLILDIFAQHAVSHDGKLQSSTSSPSTQSATTENFRSNSPNCATGCPASRNERTSRSRDSLAASAGEVPEKPNSKSTAVGFASASRDSSAS